MDEIYLIPAIRYVVRNPVRAGLVKKAWEWKWSSAKYHTGRGDKEIKLGELSEFIELDQSEWEEYLDSKESEEELDAIRKNTMKGRPHGGMEFMEKICKKSRESVKSITKGKTKERSPKKKKKINK